MSSELAEGKAILLAKYRTIKKEVNIFTIL
jgi:hypothetical protein